MVHTVLQFYGKKTTLKLWEGFAWNILWMTVGFASQSPLLSVFGNRRDSSSPLWESGGRILSSLGIGGRILWTTLGHTPFVTLQHLKFMSRVWICATTCNNLRSWSFCLCHSVLKVTEWFSVQDCVPCTRDVARFSESVKIIPSAWITLSCTKNHSVIVLYNNYGEKTVNTFKTTDEVRNSPKKPHFTVR